MKYLASGMFLVIAGLGLIALLWRWRRNAIAHVAPLELRIFLQQGRWSQFCSALLLDASVVVLGPQTRRPFLRTFAIATLLLVLVLSLAGLKADQILGLSDWPWNLFDKEMAAFVRETTKPESSRLHNLAAAARSGYWQYAYAALVVPTVLLTNGMVFWLSLRSTRFFATELDSSQSWAQKAGLMLGQSVVVFILENALAFIVGTLTSTIPLLIVFLALIGVSDIALFLSGLAVNIFTLYVADPWLKGLLISALFPALVQLTLTTTALFAELTKSVLRGSQLAIEKTIRERLRSAFLPALMVVTAAYFIYWFLGKIV